MDDIGNFDIIEERRLAKRNIQKYNYIRNIHHKVRTIKNTWLVKQDREAEELLLNTIPSTSIRN